MEVPAGGLNTDANARVQLCRNPSIETDLWLRNWLVSCHDATRRMDGFVPNPRLSSGGSLQGQPRFVPNPGERTNDRRVHILPSADPCRDGENTRYLPFFPISFKGIYTIATRGVLLTIPCDVGVPTLLRTCHWKRTPPHFPMQGTTTSHASPQTPGLGQIFAL